MSKRKRPQEDEEADKFAANLNETSVLIDCLLAMGQRLRAAEIPMACFVHQLYSTMPGAGLSKTRIEEDLSSLRSSFEVRVIHTPLGQAVMRSSTYLSDVEAAGSQCHDAVDKSALDKFLQWVRISSHISVSFKSTEMGGILSDAEVAKLVNLGFLSSRRDVDVEQVFWVTHPKMKALVTNILSTRKAVLNAISRTRFKEISETELQKRKIDSQILSPKFYHLDLLGSGAITRVTTASGQAWFRVAGR
jgi:Serine-threonine protein kinase 19